MLYICIYVAAWSCEERHLVPLYVHTCSVMTIKLNLTWLDLTWLEICEKKKVFLLDAPISQPGLFGEAVNLVVEKFRSAKTQSATQKQFMPRKMRDHSTPSSTLSREHSLPRKEPTGRKRAPAHPPPTTAWEACGRPFPHQRSDLKQSDRPAASAPLSRSWSSGRDEESFFRHAERRDHTAKAYLSAPNTLSSVRSVIPTPQGSVCRKRPPASLFFGLAVGGRIRPSPSTTHPFAASGLRDRRHTQFSPTAYGPRVGHFSVQCFTLHHLKQGRRGLSFMVKDVTSPRPSRHPKSSMSSSARHSASSIAFPSRMGASTRGIPLGSQHSSVRLHTSVWAESPPLKRGSAESSKQRLEGFCATAGTFLPPTKGSNRGSTSIGHWARLFQLLLPHNKKRQRPETHSGPASPEPLPLQREVQDADVEDDHVPDSGRGLVHHYRLEGCLFSHPGRPAAHEVPSVCLWREGLPIQGPSLWPGLGAENIHKVHGCCAGPFEVPGHSHAELLGRLAHSGPLQGVSESSQRYRPPSHLFSWPQNERQEEFSLPLSANGVFGGSLGFRSGAGPSGSCLDFQFSSMSGPLQARPSCLSEYLPQVARPHGSGLPCAAPRVAPHEAVPLVDESAKGPPHGTSYSPNKGVAQLLSCPLKMARPHFSLFFPDS